MKRVRVISRCAAAIRWHPRWSTAVGAIVLLGAGVGAWFMFDAAPPRKPAARTVLVLGPEPRPTRVVTFEEGCASARCHADKPASAVVHAPVAQGACGSCHAPDSGGHVYPLRRGKAGACDSCHDSGSHGEFQHKAMSEEACLACHDPHGSKTRALLKAPTTAETCAACHPRSEGHVVHKPYAVDRCDSCHDPHGADNPSLLLGGAGADHCTRCHMPQVLAMQNAAHTHRDAEGSCLACHTAHASGQKGLLSAPPGDLCVTCHTDVCETVAGAAVSHDPVLKGQQCITCHEPHATDRARMLRDTQARVCLSCHDKPVTAADGRTIGALGATLEQEPLVHGAITVADCSACHAVHGGTHAQLLRELNPALARGSYEARTFALCFSCHDAGLAEAGGVTQFRDGARNLHEAHLKSRNGPHGCGSCHSVHAGNLPRLVARTVNFEGSDWAMPIGFVLTEEGGRCGPGCHEPLSYSRAGSRNGGVK